jgi:hypothetical protein
MQYKKRNQEEDSSGVQVAGNNMAGWSALLNSQTQSPVYDKIEGFKPGTQPSATIQPTNLRPNKGKDEGDDNNNAPGFFSKLGGFLKKKLFS